MKKRSEPNPKLMKPVKAWVLVRGSGNLADVWSTKSQYVVFQSRKVARFWKKMDERIARILITEVKR